MIQHKIVIIKSKKETFKYLFKSSNPLIPVVFQIVPSIVIHLIKKHSPIVHTKTNIPIHLDIDLWRKH